MLLNILQLQISPLNKQVLAGLQQLA